MKTSLIIAAVSAGLCLVIIIGCWCYLNHTLNRISGIISDYITHRRVKECDVEETRESKLVSQLRKLISIADREAKLAGEEKEAITRLVSDLSHQLKTPLANISMYTQLLREPSLSEVERQEFLLRTNDQVAKMEWLLQMLLKTSRLEIGMIDFEIAPNDIKKTIADAISAVYAQAEKKNIRLCTEEFEERKLLHNPKWTSEALANILENAVKYSPCGSEITIRLEQLELYSRIEIRDKGIGIATDEFNLIFQRFYRSKSVEQQEGSGLGLYLAQLILTKQGGYITVSSVQGKGSSFSIYLQNAIRK
jgi:signal transduction histidine kinase